MDLLFQGIVTGNQSGVGRPFLPMAIGGGIIGMSLISTLSPARSRRIIWSLTVLMAAMVASEDPLPLWQSGRRPRSPPLLVSSGFTVEALLAPQPRLVPEPCNGREIASQNPLPQRQSRRRTGCPKRHVPFEPRVRPKLPIQ